MSSPIPLIPGPRGVDEDASRLRVGTLSYTTRGLLVLFAWLLWGDFCFTLMEYVVPSILPLKLQSLQAPNWVIALIITTLPGVLNMTICPWVSFKSDRYRSKWGRRIPFILATLPLLCVSLVAMGWTGEISHLAIRWLPATWGVAPVTLTIVLLGLFMVIFSFFNMFVNSVFWYLFNDVVPAAFLGRFFGLFRMVGTLAGALFNFYIYQYAETHMREIFTGAAILYFVGFGIVCFRVKEGEYPAPPAVPEGDALARFVSGVKAFCAESYTNRFYWYFHLTQTFVAVAGAALIFNVFFYKEMGLNLHQIGIFTAVGSVSVYFILFYTMTTIFANWVWVPVKVPATMFFWLSIGMVITSTFGLTLSGNATLPVFMRLLPPSRYGQFCSATALVRSLGTIVAGILAGAFLDGVKWVFKGSDFAYRFVFVWAFVLSIGTAVFFILLYREWRRLGGDEHFHAPAPWLSEGFEDMSDKNRPVSTHRNLLLLALRLFTAGFVLHLLALPVFLFFFHQHGLTSAFQAFLWIILPLSILMTGIWVMQVRSVRRDILTESSGGVPRLGIPHHGVIMVMAIQGFFVLPLLWLQLGWTLRLDMEKELVWFGVSMLTTLAPNLIVLQLLRLIEGPVTPKAHSRSRAAIAG